MECEPFRNFMLEKAAEKVKEVRAEFADYGELQARLYTYETLPKIREEAKALDSSEEFSRYVSTQVKSIPKDTDPVSLVKELKENWDLIVGPKPSQPDPVTPGVNPVDNSQEFMI